ncbi:hypothetical protein [Sediminibacterium sp.]|uniref:hypothetical protein n=1 Tax=Sediminibacterium sp. TaxID=1917865 RepID=UPI0025F5C2E0|nr:hypothetical protein [Sediminibacterium sp.]
MSKKLRPFQNRIALISTTIIILFYLTSCTVSEKATTGKINDDEQIYLRQISKDFIQHKEDVTVIYNIGSRIVKRIDSLFNGLRKDTVNSTLISGIMTTRSYDLTILAYKDILNGNYIKNANLKLEIATHIARFEGLVQSKRSWDEQWDKTARPYIYDNGLFKSVEQKSNLISDPVFRSVLFDRRMFAHDVEIITPGILSSADSVIASIDVLLKSRSN